MSALLIAANDLKRLMRERAVLFWIFVGPVLFVTFFGILLRPQASRPPVLTVVNEDQDDYVARSLRSLLERDKIVVRTADRVAPEGWTVVIPRGAAEGLSSNRPVKPVFHAAREETSAERNVRFKVAKALMALYLATPSAGDQRSAEAVTEQLSGNQVIAVKAQDLAMARREMTLGFQRSVPSYLVMFVLLNLLALGAGLTEERASGRMRRLFIAPVSRTQILLGKLLTRFAVGWIQMAYMLALGVLVFRIHWAEHSWVFLGFLSIYALAAAALGMLIGTLFDDPDKASTAGVWTAILLSPLGGLWWPLEVVGPAMRNVGHLVPTGWAMEGVNSMLAFGAGAGQVAPYAMALLALFVVSFTLAARRLRP